ncbi:MAG: hypothetical protein JSW23_05670 [Planctomycetota bacterium]|nr:MAG: hypothetical protein JSW23_05670 [Planctomycetota bacterium]
MRETTKIAIGVIGAGILVIYALIVAYTDIADKVRLIWHPALNLAIVIGPIYAFSLLLEFLTIARIAYYIWVVLVILGSLLLVVIGMFTSRSDNFARETTLIILGMVVFSILLIAPFAIGISGLKERVG